MQSSRAWDAHYFRLLVHCQLACLKRFTTLDHVIIILFHLHLLNFSKEINNTQSKQLFNKLCRAKHLIKQIQRDA